MKIFTFCFLILFLQNCTKKQTKRISFNQFTIEIPNGWKEIRISGIDSEVGAIVTEENDTIHFDYGPYSNSLEENIVIYDRKFLKMILTEHPDTDTSQMIIVSDINKVNEEDFKINKNHFKSISGYNAKIVSSKKSGNGLTGIYIDSLGTSSIGKIKFNLYSLNLNTKNQKELLTAIKTIKFKK